MASITSKADDKPAAASTTAPAADPKPEAKAVTLGEDDEFEDFPVDGASPLAKQVDKCGGRRSFN